MEVRQAVGEDLVLLAEFNHRLFNTLQIISAMILRARRDAARGSALETLADLEERLAAMGRMHRLLSAPVPSDGLEDHCRTLCLHLVRAFGRADITPWVVMEPVSLSCEQSFSLSLLVVELVTNVLKHSLAGQANGMIWVDLRTRADHIELCVSDNRKAPLSVFAPSRIVCALASALDGEAFVKEAGGWVAGARIPRTPRTAQAFADAGLGMGWRAAI
jgi:two-component sensor histidine kinase